MSINGDQCLMSGGVCLTRVGPWIQASMKAEQSIAVQTKFGLLARLHELVPCSEPKGRIKIVIPRHGLAMEDCPQAGVIQNK